MSSVGTYWTLQSVFEEVYQYILDVYLEYHNRVLGLEESDEPDSRFFNNCSSIESHTLDQQVCSLLKKTKRAPLGNPKIHTHARQQLTNRVGSINGTNLLYFGHNTPLRRYFDVSVLFFVDTHVTTQFQEGCLSLDSKCMKFRVGPSMQKCSIKYSDLKDVLLVDNHMPSSLGHTVNNNPDSSSSSSHKYSFLSEKAVVLSQQVEKPPQLPLEPVNTNSLSSNHNNILLGRTQSLILDQHNKKGITVEPKPNNTNYNPNHNRNYNCKSNRGEEKKNENNDENQSSYTKKQGQTNSDYKQHISLSIMFPNTTTTTTTTTTTIEQAYPNKKLVKSKSLGIYQLNSVKIPNLAPRQDSRQRLVPRLIEIHTKNNQSFIMATLEYKSILNAINWQVARLNVLKECK